MNTITYPEEQHDSPTFVEVELMAHYVRPGWIKKHYGVSAGTVYRAIWEGRLKVVRTRCGAYLIDTRNLPKSIGR